MCLGCHWAIYRDYFQSGMESNAGGVSRRQALRSGLLAASAAATASRPSFVAEAIAAPGKTADIVFRNGPIYTVDADRPWARAVAVKGKQIVFVGDDAGLKPFIGKRTRIVDLSGKMMLPGFVEGHIHPLVGAALTRGVDLQLDTREAILAALKTYRAKLGKVAVVRGFGWRYHIFPSTGPRREDLDALWPDTPVILLAIDGHSAWVNSKALELAGVTKSTRDPLPGFSYFERDPATGEPTGYLVEPPVILQVNNAIEPFSVDYVLAGLEEWLPKASAAGVTTVFDAGIQILPDREGFAIYSKLEQSGKLPFRVVGSYYHNKPTVDPLPAIDALRREFQSELVQARILKLNIDGGDAQRTAAMLAPYTDAPGTSGDTLLPPDTLNDIVRRADKAGLDIHIHSYGDRATRLSLDAFEAAIKANPPRERRNALAHIILIDPQDIPRFGKLGVVAQFSGQWALPDRFWSEVSLARLGPERCARMHSIKSVARNGAVVSFGTDWPAAGYYSTYCPLDAIQVAVTRRELEKPQGPQMPPVDEAISLDAALRAATMGPAYQLRLERKVGSIEVGKFADLVILEKNLFEVAPQDIHKTRVLMTVMNGKVTHEHSA